jgi:hypothetical protein
MKNYLVLFREPDGRTEKHSDEEVATHQTNWKAWMEKYGKAGNLAGGSGLTLNGRIIKGAEISEGTHKTGTEIVGGFLLLKASSLDEATDIARTCPIYEFGGYAEVREMTQ